MWLRDEKKNARKHSKYDIRNSNTCDQLNMESVENNKNKMWLKLMMELNGEKDFTFIFASSCQKVKKDKNHGAQRRRRSMTSWLGLQIWTDGKPKATTYEIESETKLFICFICAENSYCRFYLNRCICDYHYKWTWIMVYWRGARLFSSRYMCECVKVKINNANHVQALKNSRSSGVKRAFVLTQTVYVQCTIENEPNEDVSLNLCNLNRNHL